MLKTLRADMRSDKLFPPGDMFWINAANPIVPLDLQHIPLTLHEVEEVELAFCEIMFSKTMFFDHIISNYQNALDGLAAALQEAEDGAAGGGASLSSSSPPPSAAPAVDLPPAA